mmetsp:Transcript_4411/g.13916  ORF Transcript_4411/g.13916 Transcript_4411/m.13916 type:complete len:351 (+) Transcript_4411:67-1119(+)
MREPPRCGAAAVAAAAAGRSEAAVDEFDEEGFLGVESIFRLIKHNRLRPVDDLRSLLLAAHGGQAVHEHRRLVGELHETRGDLERHQSGEPLGLCVAGDAVRHPRVAVDRVDARDGLFSRAADLHAACAELLALLEDAILDGEVGAGRPRDAAVDAHDRARSHEVVGDVVLAVSHKREFQPSVDQGQRVAAELVLRERLQVGEHLHGVRRVVQSVDDGHRRVLRKPRNLRARPDARRHGIDHAREHGARVFISLLFAQRRVAGHVRDRVAPELSHAHLQRDARAQARLLEEHEQRLLLQSVGVPQRRRLHVDGHVEDADDLRAAQAADLRHVAQGGHFGRHIRGPRLRRS